MHVRIERSGVIEQRRLDLLIGKDVKASLNLLCPIHFR